MDYRENILVRAVLAADVLGTLSCKPSNFRKRVRKVINKTKLKGDQRSEVKRSELWLSEGKDT
jgi:hypothetical protein